MSLETMLPMMFSHLRNKYAPKQVGDIICLDQEVFKPVADLFENQNKLRRTKDTVWIIHGRGHIGKTFLAKIMAWNVTKGNRKQIHFLGGPWRMEENEEWIKNRAPTKGKRLAVIARMAEYLTPQGIKRVTKLIDNKAPIFWIFTIWELNKLSPEIQKRARIVEMNARGLKKLTSPIPADRPAVIYAKGTGSIPRLAETFMLIAALEKFKIPPRTALKIAQKNLGKRYPNMLMAFHEFEAYARKRGYKPEATSKKTA